MLWILVQTGHITSTLWNAVNISPNRSTTPTLRNAVNISPNRSYNPPHCCETLWILVQTGQLTPRSVETLWILVQTGHITLPHAVKRCEHAVNISPNRSYNPPCCETLWTLWILVQTGHITPYAVNAVNAVNISPRRSTIPTLWNAVNISPNRSYNPHTVKHCEY